VITDLKANLRRVAKEIKANPHLKKKEMHWWVMNNTAWHRWRWDVTATYQAQPQNNVLLDEEVKVLIEEQHGWANQNCIQVLQLILCHVCHLHEGKKKKH
jgi:hypothetical protein